MRSALTIAGSDSSGGAGIQADLKTFTARGVWGMSALTAITAQNTQGVQMAQGLGLDLIRAQIDSVCADIRVHATKTGMLATPQVVELVADAIATHGLSPYVCDPVMFAKSGDRLLDQAAVDSIRQRLFPLATLITPNRREAALLAGVDYDTLGTLAAAREAARRLCDIGARAVVIKSIPVGTDSVDVLYDGADFRDFAAPRKDLVAHGGGCTFSAAITALLARGLPLAGAVEQAKAFMDAALAASVPLGRGATPVNSIFRCG